MSLPVVLIVLVAVLNTNIFVNARILQKCDAVKELERSGISKTLFSNWICLMQNESGLDTSLVKGPGTAASFSFGIFQISSLNGKYCIRGRPGGKCNKRCEDFTSDDITDDIACAKKIYDSEGFKYWKSWLDKCKNKPLPNLADCK